MADHLRVKSPWSQLGILLGLLGIFMIVTYAVSAIAIALSGLSIQQLGAQDWSNTEYVNAMKTFQAISSFTIFLLPAVVFAFVVYSHNPLYHLGLGRSASLTMYLLSVICMLASFPLVSLLGDINHSIPLPQWMVQLEKDTAKQMTAFLKADNVGQIIINVVVMALLPALGEELLFRGGLQNVMIRLFRNPWTGIILTAILFSALHLQFLGFLPRLFLGVALGAIYYYSGSLWVAIVAHFVYNAVQVVGVSYAPEYIDKNPEIPLYFSLVSAFLVIGTLLSMRARAHRNIAHGS
jgi:membrane protease YdiL (CAAX protease family)